MADVPPEQKFRHLEASTTRGSLLGDCLAVIAAAIIATSVRLALAPIVGSAVPFATYFAAALILAWYRGLWPAVANIPLSILAYTFFILPRAGHGNGVFGRTGAAAAIGFTFLSFAASFLIDAQRRTLYRARKAEAAQAKIGAENAILLENAKRAAEELRLVNEELRRSNRDLETFAYSASHDLREPLRTISLCAELAERKTIDKLTGDGITFLGQIKSSAKRMNALLEDLLAYSKLARIENGPLPKVDASQVLRSVLANLQGQLDEAGAIVTADPLPMVQIHESSLALLFQNVISNAVKYRGDDVPRVHVTVQRQDGQCVFSIVDNGIGISTQFSDHIFELFTRLHTHDKYSGSGMGLAICKRLLARYGGKIWLQRSEEGRGSTFCFALPEKTDR